MYFICKLLAALQRSMPSGVRLILVTDAGFRAPWFEAVSAIGWDWIGRLRGGILVQPCAVTDTPDQWVPCPLLYELVGNGPKTPTPVAFRKWVSGR